MTFVGALRGLAAATLLAALGACATADPNDLSATDKVPGFNKAMLDFNIAMDKAVLRPAAQGYDFVTPTLFKHLIGNGFDYLELPGQFINFALQGEVTPALETLGRFTINTVVGIGVLDPATDFGLPKHETDFGVTLGKHGVPEGTYLVLPVFGPSTARDAAGTVVDMAFSPLSYLGVPSEARLGARALDIVDTRDRNFELIDDLLYESEDPYVSLRSVYLQRRRSLVGGEEAGAEGLPDIFDEQAQ